MTVSREQKIWLIVCCGTLFAVFAAVRTNILGDQDQLYHKGNLLAVHSIWIHYGNKSSGGVGNTPGSLTTALVGLPMLIWYSPYSPLILIFLFHLMAYLLLDKVIGQSFGARGRTVFAILYWFNPWRATHTFLWNPNYLILFTALHFWSAFQIRETKKFWPTLLHTLSIGMALQLHFSTLIMIFHSLFLFWRKIIKPHWPAVIIGIILTSLSLIPYLNFLFEGREPATKDSFLFRGLLPWKSL